MNLLESEIPSDAKWPVCFLLQSAVECVSAFCLQPETIVSRLSRKLGDRLSESKLMGCYPQVTKAKKAFHQLKPSFLGYLGKNDSKHIARFICNLEENDSLKPRPLSFMTVFLVPLSTLQRCCLYQMVKQLITLSGERSLTVLLPRVSSLTNLGGQVTYGEEGAIVKRMGLEKVIIKLY